MLLAVPVIFPQYRFSVYTKDLLLCLFRFCRIAFRTVFRYDCRTALCTDQRGSILIQISCGDRINRVLSLFGLVQNLRVSACRSCQVSFCIIVFGCPEEAILPGITSVTVSARYVSTAPIRSIPVFRHDAGTPLIVSIVGVFCPRVTGIDRINRLTVQPIIFFGQDIAGFVPGILRPVKASGVHGRVAFQIAGCLPDHISGLIPFTEGLCQFRKLQAGSRIDTSF